MTNTHKISFSYVADLSGESDKIMHSNSEGEMPILCVRDSILFPGTMNPVTVGRSISISTLKEVERGDGMVAVFPQKDPSIENPTKEDLYLVGIIGKLIHFYKMPDGNYTALIHAFNRTRMETFEQNAHGCHGLTKAFPDEEPAEDEMETFLTMVSELRNKVKMLAEITEFCPIEFSI